MCHVQRQMVNLRVLKSRCDEIAQTGIAVKRKRRPSIVASRGAVRSIEEQVAGRSFEGVVLPAPGNGDIGSDRRHP